MAAVKSSGLYLGVAELGPIVALKIAPLKCKLVQTLWKSVWWFLRRLGITLPQDPAIPILGIYPKDAQSYYKDICSTVFIAALFVIDGTWK